RLHRTHRHLSDAVLHAAVVTLRKSAETRERGILYEHRAEDEGIQTVVLALRHAFAEHAAEGRVTEPSDQDLLPVLRALDQALAECMKTESDDQAFLGSAARLTARFSEPRPAAHLIVTP
ncbi:MAG: hypothetical protein MUF51_04760, partial [Vicinamibacteria bacterium]|nr:hypothetical protein [Vicinamibacteria bacterium]